MWAAGVCFFADLPVPVEERVLPFAEARPSALEEFDLADEEPCRADVRERGRSVGVSAA